ncbi:hypothetical protein KAFR_0A03000 [Kazachstania africana CBS 2517]|uniref:ERCC1-like central domain-containing protein n=1 Tax=Kazachstania africana (strain ATCC 22294 / BCRC 22015 / CBS 2517 / CECT 1963 / NBRC 1671 / NRRL Y-8276) TaxID=1071382 RepID=H2AMY5_KAZAF|nr:hypothetical protein KAFR_0A03000 [Kazachstania africana CBS 2517]CCF55735.1 hypothetical protein KAFR_0A03000 [Kazachstania africana CBS 2517]
MNNTDPTSFQSILAGVKRLREQKSGTPDVSQSQQDGNDDIKGNQQRTAAPSPSPRKVINTFNQQRSDLTHLETKQGSVSRPVQGPTTGKSVLVNTTQKENPLLNSLKNTNWRYISSTGGKKIYYDYFIRNRSILFLTLSYHKLYPDYITRRMASLSKNDDNILIFVVDTTNSEETLNELTKQCMFSGFTLLVVFNFEQAAKYIEYLNS